MIIYQLEFVAVTLPGWPQVDPKLTFDPKTKVEGLKLMLLYESYGDAM